TAPVGRGRQPTLLYVRTRGGLAAAVTVRHEHTTLALVDFAGHAVARDVFATPASPDAFGEKLADRLAVLIESHAAAQANGSASAAAGVPNGVGACYGVGIVVPGMVDRRTGRVLYAPRLGWRDVDLRATVRARLNMPVY